MPSSVRIVGEPSRTSSVRVIDDPKKPSSVQIVPEIEGPSAIPEIAESGISGRGGSFIRGVRRGTAQSVGLFGQVLKSVGDLSGLDKFVEVGDELIQEAFVEAVTNPGRIHGFEDLRSIGDLGEFVKQTLGEQVFNIATMAVPGGLGAKFAMAAVGKKAAAEVAKRAALKGAAIGGFAGAYPLNTGEILQEQRDAGGEPNFAGSAIVGAGSSALEILGFGIVGKALFGQAKQEVVDHTLRTVLGRVGHTSLKGLAGEGGTEAVQEAMVIASRKLNDPTFSITEAIASSEGLSRIAFAGASGAVVGGVLAGGGGAAVGAAQAAQLGVHRAKLKADTLPGLDALKELSAADQGEEVNSVFSFSNASKKITENVFKPFREKMREYKRARKNKLADSELQAAADAVEVARNKAFDDMSIEFDALEQAEAMLTEAEQSIVKMIASVRATLKNLPQVPEGQIRKPRHHTALAEFTSQVEELRNALPEKASPRDKAHMAQNMMELIVRTLARRLDDPLAIKPARVEKQLTLVEGYINQALKDRREQLSKSRRLMETQQNVLEREAQTQRAKLPADRVTPELRTPEAETQASLDAVKTKAKRGTFIRGVGANPANLSKGLQRRISQLGLVPRPDPANNRIVVVRPEDRTTRIEDIERADFARPIDEVGENAAVATQRDAKGTVVQNEVIPATPEAVQEAAAKGAEVRSPEDAVIESVKMRNDEVEALGMKLTLDQLEKLVDEQSVLYVRMPNNNRIMPAVIGLDDTLQREDGGKFSLFESEEQIDAALELKTSEERFADLVEAWNLDNKVEETQSLKDFDKFEKVKIGDKYVLRAWLPGNRTAARDRQVRKIVRRGDSTPNKARYTILGSKNGKEVRLHLGEVTKLGLMDEGGETVTNRPTPNAQTAFLNGLYTLAADYGFSILFNPETQGNKIIYGQTAYKDAGYYQEEIVLSKTANPRTGKREGFSETDFADWVMQQVADGELNAEEVSSYLWSAGNALSAGELTAFLDEAVNTEKVNITPTDIEDLLLDNVAGMTGDAAAAIAKATAKRLHEVVFPTGKKGEEARRGSKPEEALEGRTPVVQTKETPFKIQFRGRDQHVPWKSTGQFRNYISSWPEAQKAVEVALKLLHIKDNVVLFDEDSASLLLDAYRREPASAARDHYIGHIERVLEEEPRGRAMKAVGKGNERVYHIYMPKNTRSKLGRNVTLMHEIGHIVHYAHLDRLSPKLRKAVLDSFINDIDNLAPGLKEQAIEKVGREGWQREAFAFWMAKAAVDMNYNQRLRAGTEVDSFFAQVLSDLKLIYEKLKGILNYPKPFDQFVTALHTHAASQRGEKVQPLTGLAKRIFDELEAGPVTTEQSTAKIERAKVVKERTTNIYYGSGENKILSNLAKRPFKYKGKNYVSVEHAYQTWKSGKFDAATYGKLWKDGTKHFGKRADRKTNVQLMRELIKLSFEANPEAKQALLATGNAKLTHLQDKGIWRTKFPELLMEYRDSLSYDDMSIEVDAVEEAVEQTKDRMFQSYIDGFQRWAATLQEDPKLAIKTLIYTADGELRAMNSATALWLARQFHALPVSGEPSNTVFREISIRGARFHTELKSILNSIPAGKLTVAESLGLKKIDPELMAKRKRLNQALLLQTPINEVDADIRGDVREIRRYLNKLYNWYTRDMGLSLRERENYYPMMLDTLVIDKKRDQFIEILRRHRFSERKARQQLNKLLRDEDGGLNNGFHGEELSSEFLGPGFTSKQRRQRDNGWTDELRADLVEAGFYQHDIATTMVAYTEMIVRRAVWERRFSDPNRRNPTQAQIREYESRGLSIHHPMAALQLKLYKAHRRGELTDWQYKRINEEILPAYAGQLGLRTNHRLRKLNAAMVIYQNLRILSFAIFSQFVDVGTILARGDFKAAEKGLQMLLKKSSREEALEMLEAIGGMRQGLTEHILNDQALNTFMTGRAKKINDLFFHYNLMEGWTNQMRALALITGRDFMKRHAQKALNGSQKSQRYLDELDITPAEVVAWDGQSTGDIRINAALNRFIDEGMIRPDASIRPVWMSDPGYAVFSHLKGFLYGFYETFLKRVGREAVVHQNLLPLLVLGMMTLPFAALGYELRRKVLGTSKNAPEGFDYAQELFERAGLLGPFQLVVDMEQADQYGKPYALGIGGPTVEQLFDFVDKDLSSWTPRAIPVVASIPAAREWVRDTLKDEQ